MEGIATEITVRDLKRRLDQGEDLFFVDVRNKEEFDAWKIEGRTPIPTLHVPYFDILEEVDNDEDLPGAFAAYAQKHWTDKLPRDHTIVVVCAKGGTSALVAEGLQRLGYRATSLEGGMVAWGNFYEIKPIVETVDLSVYQVIRPARGCLSYIAASGGEAVVIDPLRDIDQYVDFARDKGMRITTVLDTHGHADHISGGRALADRLGVPYHFHPYDAIHPIDVLPATIPYEPLQDGQEFRFGNARLKVIHIPGHTLGNIVYLLNDRYLFSGDSIFIESIARPDLGGRGETWSPLHYHSLARLLELPDATVILPGHFSSPAEANADATYARTLGELKRTNEGLQMVEKGEKAFIDYLLSSLPTFPPQYVDIKRVNAGLLHPDEDKASELELGRNICALSHAYQHA